MSLDISLSVTMCDKCGSTITVFDRNITHNLGKMARKAGLYDAMWDPYSIDLDIRPASMIPELIDGIRFMVNNRLECEQLAPENGWGTYEDLLEFAEQYLLACVKYPNAEMCISK